MAEIFVAADFCLFAYTQKLELTTAASPFIGVQSTRDKRRIMFGARVRSSVGCVSSLMNTGDIVSGVYYCTFFNSNAKER